MPEHLASRSLYSWVAVGSKGKMLLTGGSKYKSGEELYTMLFYLLQGEVIEKYEPNRGEK
jgi:hypothetical protein